jgi:group I intron endonuclease
MIMKTSVYIITNTLNAKQYVGIATNLKKRWQRHKSLTSDSPALKNAIQKYGVDVFVFTHVCDAFSFDFACDIERMLIAQHNTKSPNGYNLTNGGEGRSGIVVSNETKEKLSKARNGKTHTDASRLKMSLSQKGKKLTEEHKRKISLGHLGKKMTEEQKAKLPKRVLSEEHKLKIKASLLATKTIQKAQKPTTVLDT